MLLSVAHAAAALKHHFVDKDVTLEADARESVTLTMERNMKKSLLGVTLGALLFTTGSAVAADYKIDKEGQHAFVNFRIQHLGYSWLYGTFRDFDGTFTFDEKNPAADKVSVTINTNSVDTNHAERDKHLRSGIPERGEISKATFTSTSVKKDGDELDITGDLTLNGVTKPVTLEAKLLGQGKDPWGGERAGFEAAKSNSKTSTSRPISARC